MQSISSCNAGDGLLIVGASTYAVVAFEIASDMGCFGKIAFVDDVRKTTPNGIEVIGTTRGIGGLFADYKKIVVAIGNSEVRRSLLERIKEETDYDIVSLISPKAYVSPSARIMSGCIIEPMAVVHTGCVICEGCIISAGAVINHATMCCEGVHVDCNATVEGYCRVPMGTKLGSGEVYRRGDGVTVDGVLLDPRRWEEYLADISGRTKSENGSSAGTYFNMRADQVGGSRNV